MKVQVAAVCPAEVWIPSSVAMSSPFVQPGQVRLRRFVNPPPAVSVIGPTTTFGTPKTRSLDPCVFQVIAYGAVTSSAPNGAPSSRNCTPTTPTLSLAVALMGTAPLTVAPPIGAEMATVGAVTSPSVVNVKSPDSARLFAASCDRTR